MKYLIIAILLLAYSNAQGIWLSRQSSTEIWPSAGSKAFATPSETAWTARSRTGTSKLCPIQSKLHNSRVVAQNPRTFPWAIRHRPLRQLAPGRHEELLASPISQNPLSLVPLGARTARPRQGLRESAQSLRKRGHSRGAPSPVLQRRDCPVQVAELPKAAQGDLEHSRAGRLHRAVGRPVVPKVQ